MSSIDVGRMFLGKWDNDGCLHLRQHPTRTEPLEIAVSGRSRIHEKSCIDGGILSGPVALFMLI